MLARPCSPVTGETAVLKAGAGRATRTSSGLVGWEQGRWGAYEQLGGQVTT